MKVFHVITTIERGGAENQLVEIVRQQYEHGYQVEVISLKGKSELASEITDVGAAVNTKFANQSFTRQLIGLGMYFRKQNELSILHAHLPRAEVLIALTKTNHIKITTRHNAEPFWPSIPNFLSSALSRWISNKFNAVICISKSVRQFVSQNKEIGARILNRIEVIHYGYSSKEYFTSCTTLREVNFLQIGTVARLVPQKNLETLLLAAKRLVDSDVIAFQLKLIGDGPESSKLRRMVEELKLHQWVTFLGRTGDVGHFLSQIDVFILPSRYEGFGLVYLEAIQAQVAILSSKNDAAMEVLGANHPGMFGIENFIELSELIKKQYCLKIRQDNVSYGNSRLKYFAPKKMFDSHDSLYNSLVQGQS